MDNFYYLYMLELERKKKSIINKKKINYIKKK